MTDIRKDMLFGARLEDLERLARFLKIEIRHREAVVSRRPAELTEICCPIVRFCPGSACGTIVRPGWSQGYWVINLNPVQPFAGQRDLTSPSFHGKILSTLREENKRLEEENKFLRISLEASQKSVHSLIEILRRKLSSSEEIKEVRAESALMEDKDAGEGSRSSK